ncbi:MAG: hypothetical protein US40_C0002G0098 [Candidatus Roizmanbacteria bacterium GW2011_GWC2_37_13]|uniref:EamA domain-containing protein n=1 Tax=Candidatus Roizmanbacteria bacterium GW2011_GWC2_37_13 TaxID=1618486 RepID=A0A0G0IQV3_9BACT|nr:MAG: hypothetical protein US38_C0006G0098 [Candidatus Roizmanbacteria bacterium GW2011_GWC1_37_12]KKQ26564.1 MAG: hypothetical protein US40_C0002G0098 [Candidatus Roizmanbacteria bacterium GW2011_GWC2_37_13]
MNNKTKALLAVLAIVIFSGGTSPYVKLALTKIPSFTFTFVRFFLSFLIILPLFLYRVKPRFKKNDFKLITLSLLQTGNIILFAFGVRLTMASVGQIIYSFTPILVALMSFYSLKEKISFKKILGIMIGFLGVNLIIMMPLFSKAIKISDEPGALFGNILIFVGCIGYSYYTVLSKKFLKTYSPIWLTIYFILTTALVSLIFIPYEFSSLRPLMFYLNTSVLWPVIYVITIGTVMAYLLQQYAIDRGTPLIASLMQYLFPASTLVWSYFILGERLNIYLAIGLVLILSGAWLVTKES